MIKFCIKSVGVYFCSCWMAAYTLAESVPWDRADDVWYSRESQHFICHYSQKHEDVAALALGYAEQAHQELMPFFQTRLVRKTHLTLVDPTDQSNGWASPLPYAQIRIYMKPPDGLDGGLYAQQNWLQSVIKHEYVHTLQLDMAQGFPWGGRYVLGRNPLFFPFIYTPKFLKEGIAVVLESDASTQDGRLYSSYYEMQMRMEVAAGLKDLDQVSVHTKTWPRNTAYLYGAYFYEYLLQKYGQEKVDVFFKDYSAAWFPSLGLNTSASQAFDEADFNQLWVDFQRAMRQRFAPQISERQRYQQSGLVLDRSPYLQAVSTSQQGLFRLTKDGQTEPRLQKYLPELEQWESLMAVDAGISLDVNAKAQVAFTRQINWRDGRKFADGFVGNLDQVKPLTTQGRFLQLAWLGQQEVLGRRIVSGRSELWHFDLKSEQSLRLWQGDLDVVLGQIAVSVDAKHVVASMKFGDQSWSLYRWQAKTKQWQRLFASQATELQPSFQDANRLFFSADIDGVFDVYSFDLNTGQRLQWTYEVGGAFHPYWQQELGLVYQSYETDGYALRLIKKPKPKLIVATAPQNDAVLQDSNQVLLEASEPEPYNAWQTLRPYSWLPVFQQTEAGRALGILIAGQDALGRHQYSSILGWNTSLKLPWFDFNYLYDNRWQASFKSQPLAQSVSEYQVNLSRNHLLLWAEDQGSLGLGGGWKQVEQQQEWQLGLLAGTRTERSSLYHPSVAWGSRWQTLVEYERYVAKDSGVNIDTEGVSLQAYASWSWALPQKWSLSAALQAGTSLGDFATERYTAKPSAAKGFKYASRDVRLRGYPTGFINGTSYGAAYLTTQRLIYRVEQGYSVFPYGLADIWGRLFADVLVKDQPEGSADVLPALGFELNFDLYTADLIIPLRFWIAQGLGSEIGELQIQWQINLNL